MSKFEEAKNKIILEAEQKAMAYLSSKYGVAKLAKESQVALTHSDGAISNTFDFTGRIRCFASTPVLEGYSDVGLDLTINKNDVAVEGEVSIQDNIEKSLNASEDYLPNEDIVVASLDSFHLTDNGSKYLSVSHPSLENANIGIVGKAEYNTSKDKEALLRSIVTDSIVRTASFNYKIEFTGSFVEPKIEKQAEQIEKITKTAEAEFPGGPCKGCGKDLPIVWGETFCKECVDKGLASSAKKSWLTADLEDESILAKGDEVVSLFNPALAGYVESISYDSIGNPTHILVKWNAGDTESVSIDEVEKISKQVSISENMPRAKMSGGVEQSMQAEQQKLAAEKDKLSNTAVNQLIPTLQSLGFGSARVSEVTPNLSHSDSGFDGTIDVMSFVEDKTSTKLVAFPIKVKASQIELPKIPLVRELVEKAININEKLTEQLTKEALLSLSSVDEKVAYEANEVKAILESKIEKIATENGLSGVQLVGPQDTITLQKHLLPIGTEDLAIGDKIFGDGHYWQLVDKEGMQNDKNSESSSLWKFVKCEPPKEKEEPAVRIPE